MKDFWENAKKQYYLGVDTVMKKTGLKDDHEDPNFLDHWEKLQNIEISTMNLYKTISDLANATTALCETSVATSTVISTSFDSVDLPYYDNSQKTVSYLTICRDQCKNGVWGDINSKCLAPLRQYMDQIMKLKKVAEKRKKNKVLCEVASEPQEVAKRQEKYARYNSEYTDGVEQIASQQEELFAQVFNQHQSIMQSFAEFSKKGLDVLADETGLNE